MSHVDAPIYWDACMAGVCVQDPGFRVLAWQQARTHACLGLLTQHSAAPQTLEPTPRPGVSPACLGRISPARAPGPQLHGTTTPGPAGARADGHVKPWDHVRTQLVAADWQTGLMQPFCRVLFRELCASQLEAVAPPLAWHTSAQCSLSQANRSIFGS